MEKNSCTTATCPVVFLDRDGTLNEEIGYITDITRLQLIPGAARSVGRLNKAGIKAILVTNQTGAARGFYSEEHIRQLNERLVSLLAAEGAHLDDIYYCPHLDHLEGGIVEPFSVKCNCRKPEIGMVEKAFQEHPELDRKRSYVVGDKATDVELARNCGGRAVLVLTGYGEAVTEGKYQWKVEPDYAAADIEAAIEWILKDLQLSK